jgi:indole-3-glycerol phosphate synthase
VGFLDQVLADKAREVAARKAAVPWEVLRQRAGTEDVRDFCAAVSRPGAVIAEIKTRTPTVASFAQAGSVAALAAVYQRHGAAAISVVTDTARFGTSLDDVRLVRGSVRLPVIAKDFVVDPYQIVEARAAGADAVLLIVRALDLVRLRAYLDLAHGLGMSALVEAHAESEVLAALAAGARLVGINNRDLDTMSVSLDTTRRLAHLVPDDVVLVAESGIDSRADLDDLARHGADAFLVGGSLLAAGDPAAKLRELSTPRPGGAGAPYRPAASDAGTER